MALPIKYHLRIARFVGIDYCLDCFWKWVSQVLVVVASIDIHVSEGFEGTGAKSKVQRGRQKKQRAVQKSFGGGAAEKLVICVEN